MFNKIMFIQILASFFIFIFLAIVAITLIVIYHFKKFSFPNDPWVKKILNIYILGTIILLLLSILFLILFIIGT